MSDVFGVYADYYELLYEDKDYASEANYVLDLVGQFAPHAVTFLDLGCGTGRHAELISRNGFRVHGIDRSAAMLRYAQERAKKQEDLSFSQSDIRTFQIDRRFDVAVCLFHVINYLTSDQDLKLFAQTVKQHLNPNGLLIFDTWYGPGVLTDPPSTRVLRKKNRAIEITRITESIHHPADHTVQVNFQVFVKKYGDNTIAEIREEHLMRYLFPEDLTLFTDAGFKICAAFDWRQKTAPQSGSWNACWILRNTQSESG